MVWSTEVLSSISSDTQPCIAVTFDNAKYIFNASENLGRTILQNGRNWRRTRALFFSQSSVERTSGLTGLLMSFADSSITNLNLIGPQGLTHLIASMRLYTFRDSMSVKPLDIPWINPVSSVNPDPIYTDENITVYALPLLPSSQPPAEESTESIDIPSKRKRESSPDSPRKRSQTSGDESTAFSVDDMLLTELKNENFRPDNLTDELADEYRRFLIRHMFPYVHVVKEAKLAKGKQQKGKHRSTESTGEVAASSSTQEAPKLPRIDLPYETDPTANADNYRRTREAIPTGFHLQLPRYTSPLPKYDSKPTMSYLVLGPRYRGKFDAEKAKQLGVMGANRKNLANGQSVTFQVREGEQMVERTVHPEDVLGKSEAPQALLVVDVPTISHLHSLIFAFKTSQPYSQSWTEDGGPLASEDFALRTIYHICGDGVLDDPAYKAFMKGFGPEVSHIIASRNHCSDPLTFTSAGFHQLRMNKIDSTLFPIPHHSCSPKSDLSSVPGLPTNIYPMTSSLQVQMRPFKPPTSNLDVLGMDKFHPFTKNELSLQLSANMEEKIREGKEQIAQEVRKGTFPHLRGSEVGIIPLGTGGSLPSRYRNVLSTLVKIPGWGNILLDTGEGTWGQLARNFGLNHETPDNAWTVLRDLKCIFVSHIHGDHHLGLAQILAKRRSLDPPPQHPLYVVSIRGVHLYLRELSNLQDLGLDDPSGNGVIQILSEAVHYRSHEGYKTSGPWQVGGNEPWLDFQSSVEHSKKLCQSLGLKSFQAIDVFHRCRCYGCVIRHQDGWSVAFSGDTQPTDNLVWGAKGATVLIHEATMADDQADLAKRKAHSTIGQAIAVGKKMGAKNVLLTHFSARYPKMPPALGTRPSEPADDHSDSPNVVPAFDLANLTIGDMWKFKYYIPALEANYEDTVAEGEDDVDIAMMSSVARE